MLLSWMKDFELSSSTFCTMILGESGGNLGDSGPASEASSVCFMTETLIDWGFEANPALHLGKDKLDLEWVDGISVERDLPSSDILEDSEEG